MNRNFFPIGCANKPKLRKTSVVHQENGQLILEDNDESSTMASSAQGMHSPHISRSINNNST